MAQDRASRALDRIERAIARIEAAASHGGTSADAGADLNGLQEAHQALRGKVQGAIAQIDRLLEMEDAR
jgi:hypothetical protein